MEQFNTLPPDRVPVDHFTPDKAQHIADEFSTGRALRDIVADRPGWLPSMLVVKRWQGMFPAFNLLMVAASACRAENCAEDMLTAAQDDTLQAAQARNRMLANEKLAGWLAPGEYGSKAAKAAGADDTQALEVHEMDDGELMRIAGGGGLPVIEGETVQPAEGVHPPTTRAPGIEYEVSGTKKPGSIPVEDSVTTKKNNNLEKVLPPEVESEFQKIFKEPGDVVGRSFVGME